MRFPTLVHDGRQRPIVAVTIIVPGSGPVLFDALVDTGADVSLFPQSVAKRLGITLADKPDGAVFAAVGGQCAYRLHDVELELRRPPDLFHWRASVGFVEREMSYAILGTRGLFEYFDLAYSAHQQSLELTPVGELPT